MLPNRSVTCCFSGYRPEKMPPHDPATLQSELCAAIRRASEAGYTHFISGMSRGFDLVAADAVLRLKKTLGCALLCALPYYEQSQYWTAAEQQQHTACLERAALVFCAADTYCIDCFQRRNRLMVDASSRLICFFDGRSGGTEQTVQYATQRHLLIDNLADGQLLLPSM